MNDNVVTTLYHLDSADEPLTTTELAKRVFDPETTEEVRNSDRKVRHYLDSYSHLIVADEREDGTAVYTSDDDLLHFGLGKVHVVTSSEKEVTVGFGSVMVYMDEDEQPAVTSVEFEDVEGDAGGEDD
jgi:hypothetical protein